MAKHFDIIVVGCGPTGAIASLLLAQKGLQVAIVEQHQNVYPHPRAIALNGFSMGLIKELLQDLWEEFEFTTAVEVGYVLSKDKMDEPFGKMQPPIIEGKILDLDHYGFLNWFNQPQLERLLRKKIESTKNIQTYFNYSTLIMWESDKNNLQIQNQSNEEIKEISSKYLIGADGGGSFVRKQIGASLKSLGKAISFLVVDIDAPRDALKPGKTFDSGGHQIIDPVGKRPTTFLHTPGKNHGSYKNHFRFEFALKPHENFAKLQSPESIKKLIEPYLDINTIKINRSTVYKFNSLISEQWRLNNTFTVGDATHQTSPFIGQGLNMGIRNTYNLVSKINLVEGGISKSSILDNYQIECYPDSKFIIKQSLFMGGMLFNIKPHINLLRSIIHFFNGKRGKPLDLFPAFVPETITVPNGFNPNKSSQKGYPMYNYMTADGFPRSLRTYHPTRYRIFCKETSSNISHQLEDLHSEIKPLVIALSDGSKGQETSNGTLVCASRSEDLAMHKKLFKNTSYVLMGPGYTMLGTYQTGQEQKMINDYKTVFNLV